MKTKIIGCSGLVCVLLTSILWMSQGCVGGVPPITAFVVTATPTLPVDYISNFETGTVAINPTLRNVNGFPGSFTVNTYGGGAFPNTVNNPFVLSNPGNGSNYAIHILCQLSSTGAYEADQLVCTLTSGAPSYYYDASSFTGIQFDLNILPDDTSTHRVFQIGTDVTTPASATGGTCSPVANCYNHYQATLPSGSTGGWVTKTYNWNQITYPGYGNNNGPDISTHLNKILFLQVSIDNQASVTISKTDIWIDNVKFLP